MGHSVENDLRALQLIHHVRVCRLTPARAHSRACADSACSTRRSCSRTCAARRPSRRFAIWPRSTSTKSFRLRAAPLCDVLVPTARPVRVNGTRQPRGRHRGDGLGRAQAQQGPHVWCVPRRPPPPPRAHSWLSRRLGAEGAKAENLFRVLGQFKHPCAMVAHPAAIRCAFADLHPALRSRGRRDLSPPSVTAMGSTTDAETVRLALKVLHELRYTAVR